MIKQSSGQVASVASNCSPPSSSCLARLLALSLVTVLLTSNCLRISTSAHQTSFSMGKKEKATGVCMMTRTISVATTAGLKIFATKRQAAQKLTQDLSTASHLDGTKSTRKTSTTGILSSTWAARKKELLACLECLPSSEYSLAAYSCHAWVTSTDVDQSS